MSAADWWSIGVPNPDDEGVPAKAALTYGSSAYAPYQYSLDAAAKQRWWFLLAGLAVGAGVMHWRMKRKRGRG